MRNDEVLTPYLGECLCVRSMSEEPGDLCSTCGGHIGALESNGICEECELTTGELLNCFACNVSFHRGCMPNLAWGLTGLILPRAVGNKQIAQPLNLNYPCRLWCASAVVWSVSRRMEDIWN